MLSTCNKTNLSKKNKNGVIKLNKYKKTCNEGVNKNPTNESLRVSEFHIYHVRSTRTVTETSVLKSVYLYIWHCWKNQKKHTHAHQGMLRAKMIGHRFKTQICLHAREIHNKNAEPHIEQCRAHLCPGCLRLGYFPIDRTDFVYDLNNSKWVVIQNWHTHRERDLNAVEGVHGGASLSCFFSLSEQNGLLRLEGRRRVASRVTELNRWASKN